MEEAILPFVIQDLIELIAEKKSITFFSALEMFYTSRLYMQLQQNSKAKLWYLSSASLYELLEKERKEQPEYSKDEKLFIVFCVENFKNRLKLTHENVLLLFKQHHVFEYLISNFELLHSQSEEYIIAEISRYIKARS